MHRKGASRHPPAVRSSAIPRPLLLAQFSIIVSTLRGHPKHNVPRPICYRKGASRHPPASPPMQSATPFCFAQFSIIVSILRSHPLHNVPRPICYRKGASRHPPASAGMRSGTPCSLARLAIIVSILRSQPLHNVPRRDRIAKALPVINLIRHGTGSADFFLDASCSISFPFRFHFVSCFVPVSFRKTSFLCRNNFKKQPNNVLKSFSNRSKIALACCCSCAVGSQKRLFMPK